MADAIAKGLQVLAELYPDATVREARRVELGDAGLTALGNNVLRREDHSREMNELQTKAAALAAQQAETKTVYDGNVAWFEQKKADLEELDRLRQQVAGGNPNPNPNPNPAKPDPKYLTEDAYNKAIAETERGAVAFMSELTRLSMEHFQRFGEILDTDKLLTDRRVQQLGIRGVYADVYKPQLDARAAEQAKAAEEKIRSDERTKVLAERNGSHIPYPVRGNEPSTLDAFERKSTDQAPVAKTVDEMAAEYARLGAARTGATV